MTQAELERCVIAAVKSAQRKKLEYPLYGPWMEALAHVVGGDAVIHPQYPLIPARLAHKSLPPPDSRGKRPRDQRKQPDGVMLSYEKAKVNGVLKYIPHVRGLLEIKAAHGADDKDYDRLAALAFPIIESLLADQVKYQARYAFAFDHALQVCPAVVAIGQFWRLCGFRLESINRNALSISEQITDELMNEFVVVTRFDIDGSHPPAFLVRDEKFLIDLLYQAWVIMRQSTLWAPRVTM
ncbi:hypothetical protein GLOTRDRAFT_125133 [Gloeophyllum trabeum ATCC 11539]|uniref:Uncharacterized protein n=1 Tax=Gloeophyllum trabeum (strain ATCC 11539 / FP-39264 / Madison 617) TaxID=670483 RepID=S7QG00_GLOTA|nr:uncharacterized protein GLOTRDRAFT_125133 [Gloeophyllum trabeum ATCC 11539]EPQ58806.1 hypothetical protein GLOTRDRAFT_125133 [Gloeophyllum trabeum ATCC 11539]